MPVSLVRKAKGRKPSAQAPLLAKLVGQLRALRGSISAKLVMIAIFIGLKRQLERTVAGRSVTFDTHAQIHRPSGR